MLDFEEFSKFYSLLGERPELSSIFDIYDTGHDGFLQKSELANFLKTDQQVTEDLIEIEVELDDWRWSGLLRTFSASCLGAPVDGGVWNDTSPDVTGWFHFDDDVRAF